jgi:hypothetical protein
MQAFTATIRREPGANVTHAELTTDHSFADKRVALAGEVVGWLEGVEKSGDNK